MGVFSSHKLVGVALFSFLASGLVSCRTGSAGQTLDVTGPGNPRVYPVRGSQMSSLLEVTIDSATPQKFCFGVDTTWSSLRTFLFVIQSAESCRYATFQVDAAKALEMIHGAVMSRDNLQVADLFVGGRVVGQVSRRHRDDDFKLEHLCTGSWADVCDLDLSGAVPELRLKGRD